MYEFKPLRSNQKAQKLIILFFAGSAALLILSVFLKGIPFLWVIQLLAILLAGAAVFLVTRYVTKTYEYAVESTEGGGDLTVTEISSGGKRRITVCRVSLSGLCEVRDIEGKDDRLEALKKEKRRIFDYRPDLLPEKSILAVAREGGEEYILLLAYSEEFLSILRKDDNERDI